ncbi:MAG: AmmeMemoRadiSam system protein A [Endomicrobiales bacterium]|nr:AmmeMemoRadiSam system protein A [Endomicrobiales bacterium]
MEEFMISQESKDFLLKVARESIESFLKGGLKKNMKTNDVQLNTNAAVFVTLMKNNNLRGCIGTTAAYKPLYKAVAQMAVAAAIEDTRFNEVGLEELNDIKIEISVLSPLARVKSAEKIRRNIDGVMVKKENRSGLFLPQVWKELPNKEDFLSELCSQKAGLESDAWKDESTELYTFSVVSFEDK